MYICNQTVAYSTSNYNSKTEDKMKRDVFQAIADPTRREILNMLSYQPMNVNTIAENFEVSRTAVYKHMKMLSECGLIVVTQQGRERYCEARLEQLSEVATWVEQYRKHWSMQLDSLEQYLDTLQTKKKSNGKRKK